MDTLALKLWKLFHFRRRRQQNVQALLAKMQRELLPEVGACPYPNCLIVYGDVRSLTGFSLQALRATPLVAGGWDLALYGQRIRLVVFAKH